MPTLSNYLRASKKFKNILIVVYCSRHSKMKPMSEEKREVDKAKARAVALQGL